MLHLSLLKLPNSYTPLGCRNWYIKSSHEGVSVPVKEFYTRMSAIALLLSDNSLALLILYVTYPCRNYLVYFCSRLKTINLRKNMVPTLENVCLTSNFPLNNVGDEFLKSTRFSKEKNSGGCQG